MSLQKWKKTLFSMLLILAGLSLFVLAEGILHLFNVGREYSLVEETVVNGTPYYRINRNFPQKYFRSVSSAPEFRDELIPLYKSAREKRILVLGGSTTFGFPYSYNITFPDMLEGLLNSGDPHHKWNIVNLSTSAVNSYSVSDILDHTAILEPDALILYMGHNEFYGAFGSASSEWSFTSFFMTYLILKIQETYIFQAILNLLNQNSSDKQLQDPLMAKVVRDRHIPYGSPLYLKTRLNFIKNLHRIRKTADKMNIPVFIGTLVSNERSQIPFASDFKDEELNQESLFKEFMYFVNREDTVGVEMWLQDLQLWEPNTALLAYCRGRYSEWMGDLKSASVYYSKALDLDVLRFRAGSDWNLAIRQFAVENEWTCVPVDKAFYAYSSPYAPGDDLFHEHVHPKENGYMLMAETFLKSLHESGFYHASVPISSVISHIKSEYPITPFELKAGELTIQKLRSRWPFTTDNSPFTFSPSSTTDHYAWEYLNRNITWGKANQSLTDYHMDRKETNLAILYVHSIAAAVPHKPWSYIKLARIYLSENKTEKALQVLKNVDENLNDPELWLLEGSIHYTRNEYDFAIFALNEARRLLKNNSDVFDRDDVDRLYKMLTNSLYQSGRTEQALVVTEEGQRRFNLNLTPGKKE